VKPDRNIKVDESGPYSNLKQGDYVINEKLTLLYQQANNTHEEKLAFKEALGDRKLYSGLTSVFEQKVNGICEVTFEII
jgi:hypothetical protein